MTESRADPDLAVARFLLEHLTDRVLPVLDQVIARVPADQLEFRATPHNMSAAELGYHAYEVCYVLFRAVEQGRLYVDVLQELPFDPEAVTAADDILDYGRRVREYIQSRAGALDVGQVTAHIAGGGAVNDTALKCLRLMLEEAMHHRGQLVIYLRLMGQEPPPLYAW